MLHDIRLSPQALKAVAEWASDDDGAAAVELLRQSRTVVVVGQGDDRVTIDDAGTVTEA